MGTIALRRVCFCAVLAGLTVICGLSRPVQAQNAPDAQSILKALESLPAAEREKVLIEGAKKEGRVVWYTVDAPKTNEILINAFGKKYPFIEVQFIRGKSRAIVDRVLNETRANRYLFDLATTTTETFNLYPVEKVFAQYTSPAKNGIPQSRRGERWASAFIFVRTLGYNTNMVKAEDVPKTWEDLLDPRWKGKIMFDESSLNEVSTLYRKWGKEKATAYLDKLGKSGNLQIQRGRNVMSQLLAAGEAPLAVTIYAYEIEELKEKHAPVEWALIDPSPGVLQIMSVGRRAPHPYSAALLYDFVLGPDGQKIYADMHRVPANPQVKGKVARMDETLNDPRFVLENPDTTGAMGDESLILLDEKILRVSFEKKQ
jgi:iron(III) transport system substrate-binding protein